MPTDDAFAPDVPVFAHMTGTPGQRRWLRTLPDLVEKYEQRWEVTTGSPFRSGTVSWAAPARTRDGQPVVLKITWPHPEAAGEAAGLRTWAGSGAVHLHESDADDFALLIERCEPGDTLLSSPLPARQALTQAAQVLARLWEPAADTAAVEPLEAMMRQWAAEGRESWEKVRPDFDPGLVEAGLGLLGSLPRTATRTVVLHGDFNPGNVLRARREPWLAIDPKPMTGDPAFDPEPMLSQIDPPSRKPDPAAALAERYDLVVDIVGIPAERMLAWAFARQVVSALWTVAGGEDLDEGRELMAGARILARLTGL
jgi:streptomycin 6-kinase